MVKSDINVFGARIDEIGMDISDSGLIVAEERGTSCEWSSEFGYNLAHRQDLTR